MPSPRVPRNIRLSAAGALYTGAMAVRIDGDAGEGQGQEQDGKGSEATARKERLARALRENLRRRKAQRRGTVPDKVGDGPERA